MKYLSDKERIEQIKKKEQYEFQLNKWWYEFYEAAGNLNYDPEKVNTYRLNGYTPIQVVKTLKRLL